MPPLGRGDSWGYKKGAVLRDGRYKVEREVNRGGSAVVYLAYDLYNHNRKVALKVMDYTSELQVLYKSVKREVAFSAHTNHPNIVQLLDVFADKERRTLVIVWEFIEGPDLLECINRQGGPLTEPEAAFYFCQLLRGLLFMHQTGFAHRDLKPENCVLQESTKIVKLIDFGLTKHIESAQTIMVGTPEYMAPELVRTPAAGGIMRYAGGAGQSGAGNGAASNLSGLETGASDASAASGSAGPPVKRYDARKVDAWALGVLFYVLVCAQYPFMSGTGPGSAVAAQRMLMSGKYKALPATVSPGARRIIQGLLVVSPEARLDLEDVAQDAWLLQSAMAYAAPRGLAHLVEPPLAPAKHQLDAAAAAEQAQRQRRGPGSSRDADAGAGPQPLMTRTVTGSSAVSGISTVSNVSDAASTPVDASAAAIDSQQQHDQYEPRQQHVTQQQQKHFGGAAAPTVAVLDDHKKPFEPFAAAAAAAERQTPVAPVAAPAGVRGGSNGSSTDYYPKMMYDSGAGFGLAAVKEESRELTQAASGISQQWSSSPSADHARGNAAAAGPRAPAGAAAAAAPVGGGKGRGRYDDDEESGAVNCKCFCCKCVIC